MKKEQLPRKAQTYRHWTEEESEKLTELWKTKTIKECSEILGRGTSSIWNRVTKLGLKRSEEYKEISGMGYFKKGHEPHNKGVKGWQAGGNSVKTRFKLGERPSNSWRPIGSERVTKDGITMLKVSDTGTRTKDWKPLHRLVYEACYGKLKRGKHVFFKDRNRENFDPSNLIALTRAENMERNSISRYGAEFRSIKITLGWLNRKIKQAGEDNEVSR